MKVSLHIRSGYQEKTVELGNELSIGRTPEAQLMLDDEGLSRVNTTIFREGDDVLVVDEGSTNGTFLNSERVEGPPRLVKHGDRLKLGSRTEITFEFSGTREPVAAVPVSVQAAPIQTPTAAAPGLPPTAGTAANAAGGPDTSKLMLLAAIGMTVLIIAFGGIAFLVVSGSEPGNGPKGSRTPPPSTSRIPVRVIDPLGGENEDSLDDLIASWEVEEQELNAADVADIKAESSTSEEEELNVTAAFLADRQRLALEGRPPVNIRPPGLDVPRELMGDGVIKQKLKLAEMKNVGYEQPMDFADLASKRMNRELIEMPMAKESFYLDVGGSAQDKPFSSFSFSGGTAEIAPGHPKYEPLRKLAENFAGAQYDLNDASHRKQMRRRLLRMFQPKAKPILHELADSYFQQFRRPLRVTSLTRSMDYQILLNSNNANSFKVRGEGSLPPHTSGCAFDLARKHMPAEEQNFLMRKLAEMERAGKLDALIEYGANSCFHVFIYHDGQSPRAGLFEPRLDESFPFLARISLTPR
ncbi:MAG: FHA domain-containing protein [Chloracidobacterium sp.]|nr:FHA domain-containing protein [Chloracidobacterium sp.]